MADRKAFGKYARLLQKFQWMMPTTEGKIKHLPDFVKGLGKRTTGEGCSCVTR